MHWREKAGVFCGFTLLPSESNEANLVSFDPWKITENETQVYYFLYFLNAKLVCIITLCESFIKNCASRVSLPLGSTIVLCAVYHNITCWTVVLIHCGPQWDLNLRPSAHWSSTLRPRLTWQVDDCVSFYVVWSISSGQFLKVQDRDNDFFDCVVSCVLHQ